MKAEIISDDRIPGVKTSMTIYKYPQKHVMKRTDEYPNENIKNMLSSWEKKIEQETDWLDNIDETMETTIKEVNEAYDKEVEAEKKFIEERMSMDKEELYKVLYKDFLAVVEQKQEQHKNIEEIKKENEKRVREQIERERIHHQQELKKFQEAYDVWSKPIKR